jgi:hypothetical protein
MRSKKRPIHKPLKIMVGRVARFAGEPEEYLAVGVLFTQAGPFTENFPEVSP